MIVTETLMYGNRAITHTYSDENRYVVRDNISYVDAYDPAEFNRTYTEGELIPKEEVPSTPQEQELSAEDALSIILGGDNVQ